MSLGLCHQEGTFNNLHFRAKLSSCTYSIFLPFRAPMAFQAVVWSQIFSWSLQWEHRSSGWRSVLGNCSTKGTNSFPASYKSQQMRIESVVPLNSFTRINSPQFPASRKYGQIENFPAAPSNTACLENPPVFLTKEFNFSLFLDVCQLFPFV